MKHSLVIDLAAAALVGDADAVARAVGALARSVGHVPGERRPFLDLLAAHAGESVVDELGYARDDVSGWRYVGTPRRRAVMARVRRRDHRV